MKIRVWTAVDRLISIKTAVEILDSHFFQVVTEYLNIVQRVSWFLFQTLASTEILLTLMST